MNPLLSFGARAALISLSLATAFHEHNTEQWTTNCNPQERSLDGKEPNTVPIPLSSQRLPQSILSSGHPLKVGRGNDERSIDRWQGIEHNDAGSTGLHGIGNKQSRRMTPSRERRRVCRYSTIKASGFTAVRTREPHDCSLDSALHEVSWTHIANRSQAYFEEHPPDTVNEAVVKIEELTGIRRGPTQVRRFLRLARFASAQGRHDPRQGGRPRASAFQK